MISGFLILILTLLGEMKAVPFDDKVTIVILIVIEAIIEVVFIPWELIL